MKKIFIILFSIIFTISVPCMALAHDLQIGDEYEYVLENQIVVEVESSDEIWSYPRNSDNSYLFILQSLKSIKANCGSCGKSTVIPAQITQETNGKSVGCPYNRLGYSDIFFSWSNTEVLRCTSCGFTTLVRQLPTTYSSYCRSDDRNWEVRVEWTLQGGYDIHQVYDFWMNPGNYLRSHDDCKILGQQ